MIIPGRYPCLSRTLLELTLPSFCTAFRGLLGQPVAMDAEVASTMAEVGEGEAF